MFFPASRLVLRCASAIALSLSLTAPAAVWAADPVPPAPTPAPEASAPNGSASIPPLRPVDPSALKPFTEVVKQATETKGLFPLWRQDDKVWLEIAESQFGQPFLLSANTSESIGESGLYSSSQNPAWMAEFRKVGGIVQLIARNMAFRAPADAAMKIAVEQSFSGSLLAAAPILSKAHPTRASVLIDAAFLLSDIPNYSYRIEQAFRIPYALDRANSYFTSAYADAQQTTLAARMSFRTPRIPLPPGTPQAPGTPIPRPPNNLPDARSFFVSFVYSLTALPQTLAPVRLADPRLGHFTTAYRDLGQDIRTQARVHMVNRWRLEKKDPAAALSEPVKPITFWMDKNIPVRYRKAVEEGILEWNKAFEAIGFKGAVVAKQQPDDATWDTLDAAHASIRWFTGADVGFARGPSVADPRTGEIMDADIQMSDVFTRGARRFISEVAPQGGGQVAPQGGGQVAPQGGAGQAHQHGAYCDHSAQAAQELGFALDLLEARGDIEPDSPEADAYVNAVVKSTIIHEVGHTLGLKHNFKASTTISQSQLRRPGPISGSIMDYNPINLPLKGETKGDYVDTTIGAYDYWAIAYAYSVFAPGQEAQGLAAIAARSTEAALAYADDADAGGTEGLDPYANRFDQGEDPLAFYKRRVKLSQELWQTIQQRQPKPGDDPLRTRFGLVAGFAQIERVAELVGKYVGGMTVVRDLPGSTPRKTFTPVDPAKQREALGFLTDTLFRAESFRFKPEFLANIGSDFNEWERDAPISIGQRVMRSQNVALDKLLGPNTATNLLELPGFVAEGQRKGLISLNEVYGTLQNAIWSELKSAAEIDGLRRSLQREHLKRLVNTLTRPGRLPADAVSLLRLQARTLQADLQRASGGSARQSVETRAHVQDSLALLAEALKANVTRSL